MRRCLYMTFYLPHFTLRNISLEMFGISSMLLISQQNYAIFDSIQLIDETPMLIIQQIISLLLLPQMLHCPADPGSFIQRS